MHLVFKESYQLLNNQKARQSYFHSNFSPNPTPAVTDNNKQQTTETDQPKVELKTKDNDATKDEGETEDAKELAENIKEAVSKEMQMSKLKHFR